MSSQPIEQPVEQLVKPPAERRPEPIKHIDIKEFCEKGYLQEVNRQFFHPLGLALEVSVDAQGRETISGVQDHREDPEGYAFNQLVDAIAKEKCASVSREYQRRLGPRTKLFGSAIQPIGHSFDTWLI